jgi:hypothetical protein
MLFMSNIQEINEAIKLVDSNEVSDGYHTFGELYEHRIVLYITLCRQLSIYSGTKKVWVSKKHSDGSIWDGWFLLGICVAKGEQITYHLPERYWSVCKDFAFEFDKAPDFDGHTSDDVLNRLINLI